MQVGLQVYMHSIHAGFLSREIDRSKVSIFGHNTSAAQAAEVKTFLEVYHLVYVRIPQCGENACTQYICNEN